MAFSCSSASHTSKAKARMFSRLVCTKALWHEEVSNPEVVLAAYAEREICRSFLSTA